MEEKGERKRHKKKSEPPPNKKYTHNHVLYLKVSNQCYLLSGVPGSFPPTCGGEHVPKMPNRVNE